MNNLLSHALAAEEIQSSTQATTQPSGVAAGLHALGLDGRLLTAQIINFIILLLILRKYLYGPLVKLMEDRRERIADSLKKAEEIDKQRIEFQIEHEKRINESKQEAANLLTQAKKSAETLKQDMVATAQTESEKMLAKAQVEINKQKETMLAELKHEIGTLVVEATTKVVGKEFVGTLDDKMINEAISEAK